MTIRFYCLMYFTVDQNQTSAAVKEFWNKELWKNSRSLIIFSILHFFDKLVVVVFEVMSDNFLHKQNLYVKCTCTLRRLIPPGRSTEHSSFY